MSRSFLVLPPNHEVGERIFGHFHISHDNHASLGKIIIRLIDEKKDKLKVKYRFFRLLDML